MQNQCYTMSTPDASGATKYYRSHYNQWCGLHWMLHGATNPKQKTAAAFCLWRTDTNFKWFFKSHFIASRQILAVAACCVQCRRGVTPLSRRNKASLASDRRPSATWVISSAGKLIRFLHGSILLALSFHRRFPLLFLICHLFLSLMAVHCSLFNALFSTSWVDTLFTADWLQVCFGTLALTQLSKAFLKKLHTPDLTVPCSSTVSGHTTCAPKPPLQAGQGMVKWTALHTVQSSHTCEMNWTLGVNCAQAQIRFPSVSTS